MPFDLLHIVYLLLRFLVVYPKKHAVFSVVFHQKTKISVHIFCALFKHADFFLQFQCLVQFFLHYLSKFFCALCAIFSVRSFGSARFACHSPFLPAKIFSFDFFHKRKPYTIKTILL